LRHLRHAPLLLKLELAQEIELTSCRATVERRQLF
jgi:hypothetical protein